MAVPLNRAGRRLLRKGAGSVQLRLSVKASQYTGGFTTTVTR
jgi:hypothetical protein